MGEREKIAPGARFANDVVTVQKDPVFGWVVLLRDSPQAEEEAYSMDELPDDVFAVVVRQSKDEIFPHEFREFLCEFDARASFSRTRKLH